MARRTNGRYRESAASSLTSGIGSGGDRRLSAGRTHLWTFKRPSSAPTFGRSFIWLDGSFSAASRPPVRPKLVVGGRHAAPVNAHAKSSVVAPPSALLTLCSLPHCTSIARLSTPAWLTCIALSGLFMGMMTISVKGQLASNKVLPANHRQSAQRYPTISLATPPATANPDWVGSARL